VPVHPVVRVRGGSGFTAGQISVVPATVRLLGPAVRVRRLDSVTTEPLEVDGAEGPVDESLGLDTTGLGPAVRVLPSRIRVRVEVEPLHERLFTGVPVRLAMRSEVAVAPALDTVTVRVWGRAARLAALGPDSVVVLAEWRGDAPPDRVPLRVLLPVGITGRVEPDSIDLIDRRLRG
jgi:hypothetical protein